MLPLIPFLSDISYSMHTPFPSIVLAHDDLGHLSTATFPLTPFLAESLTSWWYISFFYSFSMTPLLLQLFFDSALEITFFIQSLLVCTSILFYCLFPLDLCFGCWTILWRWGLRKWKEILSLAQRMGDSKKPMSDLDELMEKTKNLSWEDVSGLMKVNPGQVTDSEALTLVGRLTARKIFPKPVIIPLIKAGWRFAPNLRIEDVGLNKFLFSFQTMEEKNHVLSLGPWNFKGYLMILKEWRSRETIHEVDLSHAQFWVQIHELPLERLDEENAILIGSKLGVIDHIDPVDIHKPYLRVQVHFDIETPLHPGFSLHREGQNPIWISFKYERLSSFCMICGRITHTVGTCIDEDHPHQSALGDAIRGMIPFDELEFLSPLRTRMG